MKKKRIIIMLSALTVVAAATISLVFAKTSRRQSLQADECNHVGHHYERLDATTSSSGHKEFWACCLCGTQFLNQPAEGTFEDAEDSAMIGGLDDTHIAYIPQITTTLPELNVLCYAKYVSTDQSNALKKDFETYLNDNGTKITSLTWLLDVTGDVSAVNTYVSDYNGNHLDAKIDVILGGKAWKNCAYINDNYASVKNGSSAIDMTIGDNTDRRVWTLNATDNLPAVKLLVKNLLDWDM